MRADFIASRRTDRGVEDSGGTSRTVVGIGASREGAGVSDGCLAETVGEGTRVEMATLVLSEWLGSWNSVSAGGLPV